MRVRHDYIFGSRGILHFRHFYVLKELPVGSSRRERDWNGWCVRNAAEDDVRSESIPGSI